MCISNLVGKACGGFLVLGSTVFALAFGGRYIILLPIIIFHMFASWYNKKARSASVKKLATALEVIFSIGTIFGYFIVSNTVFLLLPGSSALEKIPRPLVLLMYVDFVVYTCYVAHIILSYLEQDVPEEEDSSDIIRCNQMKTLNRQSV
ncbi:uncharacterized protein NESG_00975 [Nematocida ausubeli]|uniref:Uncharacterized protein n=1 Tax=Nematocida ausubeli (strain ATCC PRA-371 / ERTm2) TaxID=1913371 RepID=H8Z942_NEMA1|nr:uncharacterized protein NESG_00975 [Nematocida ausubeli]EHY66473.1 hypothetical protein NERG_00113 [Nematocida ausubeli]KFG26819.1 hypothetical protein NESG_00975 [Nematocida ausubeli]